jgi:hypothetical protein
VHAEFVALRVRHNDPFAAWFLHLAQYRRAQARQSCDLRLALPGLGVYVDVQPVFDGLRLRYALEEQASAEARAALLVFAGTGPAASPSAWSSAAC